MTGCRKTIKNTDCGGTETTLEHALAMSCNTAFAKLGVDLGQTKMLDTAQRFGFNSAPGIDLPLVQLHDEPDVPGLV